MMKITNISKELLVRFPKLRACEAEIGAAYHCLRNCFQNEHRLYVCGNGGSAADSLHMVGELVKSFRLKRPVDKAFAERTDAVLSANLQGALPAIALVENTALASAFSNDCNPDYIYAQQVYAYARAGDCVLGISTSGNSKNVVHAIEAAIGRGAFTLGMTGQDGGRLKELCDVCICVPETETYKIQELHLPVYHTICLMMEKYFWGNCD